MRLIIAGGRNITVEAHVIEKHIVNMMVRAKEVVSGGAMGIDKCGEEWAESKGIPVKKFSAQWKVFGKAAGPRRNKQMAKYADVLLAFWDGKSRGTQSMISIAKKEGIYIRVVNIQTGGRIDYAPNPQTNIHAK